MQFSQNVELGAVQKCASIVDFEACCKMSIAKIGFETAENNPRKVSMKWGIEPPRPLGVDLPSKYRSGTGTRRLLVALRRLDFLACDT